MNPEYYVFTPEALGMYTRLVAEAWSRHRGVDGVENHEDAAILGGVGHEAIHLIQNIVAQQNAARDALTRSVMADLDELPTLEHDPETETPE